ncbi:uncharacterized protein LDX57_006195 [Aspergillus melleus]|uniref:uncharacterized protein n=1 Tax=Aspergillus melleus TaxID=138277 RepID=UPI001E8D0A50|nr:uncharacterized protein LDX57_006195 [Aspergillus melleus]KAH8428496.1 hypothetical protein LDX57_006195 [Aspergillus melleus]
MERHMSMPTSPAQNEGRLEQLKSVLAQLTLDWDTVAMAIKTAVAPAVLVCVIEVDAYINYFTTNAYLAAIMAASALPALPQAKLIEYNLQLALATVVTYCWALLAGWSAVQARKHTTNSSEDLAGYNSSAEAVVAIFMISILWCVFTLKSAYPSWNLQCVLAGIYAVAAMPAVARVTTVTQVIASNTKILEVFLAGQAVGLVTGLIIFPRTCRGLIKRDLKTALDALASFMRAQGKCMDELRSTKISGEGEEERSSSVRQLEEAQQWFISTIVKARQDVIYADCEVSWDHIGGSDLEYIASLLVDLIPPASGLSSTANMMQLATEGCNSHNSTNATNSRDDGNDTTNNKRDWHYLEVTMHEHSLRISKAIMDGAEHGKVRLDQTLGCSLFGRPRARGTDEEHRVGSMRPGTASFLSSYRGICSIPSQQGHCTREEEELLYNYMRNRPQAEYRDLTVPEPYSITLRYFLLLHFQTLLSSLGGELLQLLLYLEECHAKPKRLRFPRFGRLARFIPWAEAMIRPWRCWQESADAEADVKLGLAFDNKRDPDHLPPVNLVQSVGDRIRKISSVLRTDHAAYGLRGVCAIMTIAIISFLHDSQAFYFGHQFLWAMFAILLSMGRTAGSSTFFLLCRILGTFLSMIACYLIWYIPDQTTPGILVLLWIWFTAIGYLCTSAKPFHIIHPETKELIHNFLLLVARFPDFSSIWFVALIAAIVMIATELQYRKLGQEAISRAGLVVYAPYIIFPYRLAVVTVGVLTGYFWTIIPYPLPEHYELRQNAAQSMYMLAKFYMCVRQTIFARIHGTAGNLSDKASAGFCLQGARRRAFREYQTLVGSGKKSFQFLDWEFSLGGSFPKQIYGEILPIIERLGGYMTLTEYASRSLNRSSGPSPWWNADQTGTVQSYVALDGVATRLIILHSALTGSHALPPQLRDFEMPGLGDFLSKGIPSEEGFASAALIRSINWYMTRDLNRLSE